MRFKHGLARPEDFAFRPSSQLAFHEGNTCGGFFAPVTAHGRISHEIDMVSAVHDDSQRMIMQLLRSYTLVDMNCKAARHSRVPTARSDNLEVTQNVKSKPV